MQVCRNAFRPGRGNQQIPAILIVQRFQFGIRFAQVRKALQLNVGGQDSDGVPRRAQVDGHAVEIALVISLVPGLQAGEAGLAGIRKIRIGQSLVRFPFFYRILVEPVETRCVDHIKRRFPDAVQHQGAIHRSNFAARDIGIQSCPEMDAAFGIIKISLRTDTTAVEITRIGMPGGIAVHGQAFGRCRQFVRQRRIQGNPGIHRRFRDDMDDNHRVRSRGEDLAPEQGTVPQIRGRSHGTGEVQLALVVRHGAGIIINPERPQRHITLAEMPLQAPLEPFGSRIIFLIQGFADGFQGFRPIAGQAQGHKIRMFRPLVRFAGPKGDVVERKVLMDRVAVHHGAQAAIAHGKSLFEEGRGTVVMQGQFSLRDARTGRQEQQKRQEVFHHSTGLFSIGQPVRVEMTGRRE